uniref:Uncharacterized protein n=1 Tax=Romanomermis culicivorax TaxID=13658 RepID=A0A915K9V0_ROMCU
MEYIRNLVLTHLGPSALNGFPNRSSSSSVMTPSTMVDGVKLHQHQITAMESRLIMIEKRRV